MERQLVHSFASKGCSTRKIPLDSICSSQLLQDQHSRACLALTGILKDQQLAKKKRIDSSASRAQPGNPGTRSGLYASEAVRKRCREVEEAREEAKKAKRLAEERSAEKKAERAQREKSAFKDVVEKVTRGELKVTEEGLQKLTATHMRDCLRGMGEPTPSNTRK